MYKRLEELLTDMTIGSQRDRVILAMPMVLMAPNGPFHYASRYIIGKCKLNGVTIPKCYEGCVASLCQQAEHATDNNTTPMQVPLLLQLFALMLVSGLLVVNLHVQCNDLL